MERRDFSERPIESAQETADLAEEHVGIVSPSAPAPDLPAAPGDAAGQMEHSRLRLQAQAELAAHADDPPAATRQAWLVVVNGPEDGRVIVLEAETSIGRLHAMRDASVAPPTARLHDPMISARHATISWRAGEWWLRDEESTNGTFILARQMQQVGKDPVALLPSAHLRLGNTDMIFTTTDPGREA